MADADGNRYGPYDIEVPGSEAEAFTEDAWYEVHRESGVVSGGDLTFAGLTATLSPISARSKGSYLARPDPWSAASPPTGTSSPRRDMLVLRRQRTSGEGVGATPGKTFLVLLQGTPAATPAEPASFDPANDEPLWSWQVPGSGGTVVTAIRDLRRWLSQSLRGAPIAASLVNNGGSALTAGAWTTLPLHLEDVDTHDGHTSSDLTRWVAPARGLYVVSALVSFTHSTASSLSYRGARIRKNGAAITRLASKIPVAANGQVSVPIPASPLLLSAGDYLDLQAYHNAADAITTYSDAVYSTSLNVFSL